MKNNHIFQNKKKIVKNLALFLDFWPIFWHLVQKKTADTCVYLCVPTCTRTDGKEDNGSGVAGCPALTCAMTSRALLTSCSLTQCKGPRADTEDPITSKRTKLRRTLAPSSTPIQQSRKDRDRSCTGFHHFSLTHGGKSLGKEGKP